MQFPETIGAHMKTDFAIALSNYKKEYAPEYYKVCSTFLPTTISLINISIKLEAESMYNRSIIVGIADIDADGKKIGWYKEIFTADGQYIDDFFVLE